MIGVVARPADKVVVEEFFELFKTPWEHYRDAGHYDVLLIADEARVTPEIGRLVRDAEPGCQGRRPPGIVIVLGASEISLERDEGISSCAHAPGVALAYGRWQLPFYQGCRTFVGPHGLGPAHAGSGGNLAYSASTGKCRIIRIGFNLLDEVQYLLTTGQPAAFAATPTLDLHIEFLRELIVGSGVPFVEIPPVPAGFAFIACLTHDVDHALLRRHLFDRTALGFLYRAVVGSCMACIGRRIPLRTLGRNLVAAMKLPLVYLGLVRDFWASFDRYLALEQGRPSTFFILPHKRRPGRSGNGHAPSPRGSKYEARDVMPQVRRIEAAGNEIAVHGIDAWCHQPAAADERMQISEASQSGISGIRMHWLYYGPESPQVLEAAGFLYDSTCGYNETVGYRAGTLQVFRPPGTQAFFELPLHIMDTALFYPAHANLAPQHAAELTRALIQDATVLGGTLTVNWHDRSIAPERCWDIAYTTLLEDLTKARPWFATATQAVEWFRMRRSARFEAEEWGVNGVRLKVICDNQSGLPGLRLKIHSGLQRQPGSRVPVSSADAEIEFQDCLEKTVSLANHTTTGVPELSARV